MYKFVILVALVLVFAGCNSPSKNPIEISSSDQHDHEDVKIQITAYSNEYELYAEADPFVVGHESNVLCHFSNLPDFTALTEGSVNIILAVNGKEVIQTLDKPTRKGIYSFDITPDTSGEGVITFDISTSQGNFQLKVNDIDVFTDDHDAIHDAEDKAVSEGNATFFSKEQSWKVEFATDSVKKEPFGQIIKTAGQIQPAQEDEILVTAKTNGIVLFTSTSIYEGKQTGKNQNLFIISGEELVDNNSAVRFAEAQNNYEKAKVDYERSQKLIQDKIVSESEFIAAKNRYDNSKVIYDNLNKNFNKSGQKVLSPVNGFIKECFVKNGQYVEAGQKLISIIKNKSIKVRAEVPQKHFSNLNSISSVKLKSLTDKNTISIDQLDPSNFTIGKSTTSNSYLIPVTLEVSNSYNLIPGSFVEMYLKTNSGKNSLTVPNNAILEDQGVYFVYAQVTPELFERKIVTVGSTDGIKSEILDGLTDGERIVTKGAILIKLIQVTGGLDAHSGHVH